MPPVNDDWANATVITGASGTVTGDNTGATIETGEPGVTGYVPGTDVGSVTIWWAWTAPSNGAVQFDTSGSTLTGGDTVLDVWTGSTLAGLTNVALNDDDPTGGGALSRLHFTAISGTTYYIRVNGYDDTNVGPITLNWGPYNNPDLFAEPNVITGVSGTNTIINSGFTVETGEPAVDSTGTGVAGTTTAWWKWTAPVNGNYHFYIDTGDRYVLDAWTGTAVNALTLVAATDSNDALSINFDATEGAVYYLRGNWYAAGAIGGMLLTWMPNSLDEDAAPVESLILEWSTARTRWSGAGSISTFLPLQWSAHIPIPTSTVTGDENVAYQLPLRWSATVDVEPIEDPPSAADPYIQRVSETYPSPTLISGRPVGWTPSSTVREDWGTLQLIVGGHDRSRPRGMMFLPLTVAYTEPFGDAEALFAFPGLTEYDDPAAWSLTALAPVTLRRKDPDGVFHVLYEGAVASVEPDQGDGHGVVVQTIGALYRTDLLKEPPRLLVQAQDYGDLIVNAFNDKRSRYNLNIGHMAAVKTGISGVRDADFKPFLSGAIQDYLAELTTSSGGQWTVVKAANRTPKLMLKDTTTVHATVRYGQRGVDVRLSKDFTTGVTAVYGSGSNGHCTWMGARFPNLTEQDVPAFPLTVGSVFVAGDGLSGFAPFAAFLRRGQYGTIASDDTYVGADVDNVEQFQDRAGITVDGIVGAQTWEAAFQPGANQGSLSGAYVDTIYELPQTRRHKYNAQGADVGANPAYNPAVPRIEDYIPFGDNVSKNLGRTSAKQSINRNYPAGRVGTITFTADPQEMSRWDLRAGMNIHVLNYTGTAVLVHTTRVEQDWQSGTVTCTVDEKARDQLTAAAIHQRNKDVSDLTRRQKFGRTRSKVFNDYGAWLCEDGAGEIPLMNQQGGFWNVQRIAAAPKGTIERISLAAGSGLTEHVLNQAVAHTISSVPGAARAAMLIFDSPITARSIDMLPGMNTPLTDLADGTSPVDHNQDALNARGLIYAAGGPGQAMGFYPNNDPGDGTDVHLTGMFEDGGSVDFGPTGHYWLWVCIWTPTSCKVGGRIFPGAPG